MPARHYVHPEFGYLCPAPRLRFLLRGVLISLLFATAIGAFAVKLRHDVASDGAHSVLWLTSSTSGTAATARRPASESANTEKTDRINLAVAPAAAEPQVGKSELKGSNAGKAACEADTLAYLDGRCSGLKPRWVRVPVGEKAAPAGAPADRRATTSAGGKLSAPASPTTANIAAGVATSGAQASEPSAAGSKKSSARSQSRRQHLGYWSDYARSGAIREASWGRSRW